MNTFKIATWNVNSLRVRLQHVLDWVAEEQPDVLALQETKSTDADFPMAPLQAAGYHVVASGQKTYNGVAILSRIPATNLITDIPDLEDPARRILCATIGDVCVLNLYIPNGESVTSDKYTYKLNWLKKMTQFLKQQIQKHPKMIILGDFNIAPEEIDVHDPKRWEGSVLFSLPERQAFNDMLAVGFRDCFRDMHPETQEYSWWDYRMNGFQRKMGLRIDHILASKPLSNKCLDCRIDTGPRALERPSDHAPVIAEFKLDL